MDELFKIEEVSQRLPLVNVTKLGDYKQVDDLDLETITRNPDDKGKKLNGLLLYGYETKFAAGTNENGERYSKDALDKFLDQYYKKNKLNMPLTIQHRGDLEHLAGRVLIVEVNSVGFYFVSYIPKTYRHYAEVRALIEEGVLQGFSKEGWSTKGKIYRDYKTGEFLYYLVEEMEMLALSLVTTPANGNPIEKAREIKNTTMLVKRQNNDNPADAFAEMFN